MAFGSKFLAAGLSLFLGFSQAKQAKKAKQAGLLVTIETKPSGAKVLRGWEEERNRVPKRPRVQTAHAPRHP